jgi:hypothetical protein
MKISEDRVGDTPKVDRYSWRIIDRQGTFKWMPKATLIVDEAYQRLPNANKVLLLAKAWSWIACGVIIVASRNGMFYVIDGQHRVAAARRRTDIETLPCMVYETESAVAEASGFLQANRNRKPLRGTEFFKALLAKGDEVAIVCKALCDSSGRTIKEGDSADTMRCIMTMMQLAATAPASLRSVWPLIHELHSDRTIHKVLLESLVYIEERLPVGNSLMDPRWRQRILKRGQSALLDGAMRAAAFYAKGGPKVWSSGVLQEINRGTRIHLKYAVNKADRT